MAPGSRCEAKIDRREIFLEKVAKCSRYLVEMEFYIKVGTCDECLGKT